MSAPHNNEEQPLVSLLHFKCTPPTSVIR